MIETLCQGNGFTIRRSEQRFEIFHYPSPMLSPPASGMLSFSKGSVAEEGGLGGYHLQLLCHFP